MLKRKYVLCWTVVLVSLLSALSFGQMSQDNPTGTTEMMTIKPSYLPPSKIIDFLGAKALVDGNTHLFIIRGSAGPIEIRCNDMANLIILSGDHSDIDYVKKLITQADIPPLQIEIEVQIVEISKSKALNAGIDWDNLVRQTSSISGQFTYRRQDNRSPYPDDEEKRTDIVANTRLAGQLHLLDESGAAKIHNAPRILTLNNQPAQILDGQRVTYVTRYSSYSNLYETQTMDAGLTLNVLPSLGESGYISLHVSAELTSLYGTIADSPAKSGQMIDNTIIAKDGEPVVLGGLTKTIESSTHRRFPVLGYVLPFLFSQKVTSHEEVESYIILTPRVVDFATGLDEGAKKALQDN
jgi:general secretion pathway protein D